MSDMSEKQQSETEQNQLNPTTQPFFPDITVSLAGDGDLIYVAFKVDPLMKRPGQISIQDEETGKILRPAVVPKIGMLVSNRKRPGTSGYCIINNTNYDIKPGSRVTVTIGEYRKENLVVSF
jgi:hypothetical protein